MSHESKRLKESCQRLVESWQCTNTASEKHNVRVSHFAR